MPFVSDDNYEFIRETLLYNSARSDYARAKSMR